MSQTTLCRNFGSKEGGRGRISGTLQYYPLLVVLLIF